MSESQLLIGRGFGVLLGLAEAGVRDDCDGYVVGRESHRDSDSLR